MARAVEAGESELMEDHGEGDDHGEEDDEGEEEEVEGDATDDSVPLRPVHQAEQVGVECLLVFQID